MDGCNKGYDSGLLGCTLVDDMGDGSGLATLLSGTEKNVGVDLRK